MVQGYWSYFARKVSEKNCNIFQDPFTTRSEGWIIRIVMRDGEKSKAKKRERERERERERDFYHGSCEKTNKQTNEFLRIPKIPSPPITFLMSRNIWELKKVLAPAGWRRLLIKCLYREVQPLTLLYTIFYEKGTPFVYLLLTNSTPFTYHV